MKNKINPYRRNAEVLRDFFRQPLLLVISIILTVSFLTQTLLSVYSFLTIKESTSSNTYIISILPIMGFLSLFISAHKNRTDFLPKSGLLTLAIYNIVTIALTSLYIALQIILYFIKSDRLLKLFSLQSDDLIAGAMLCAVAVSTISIIFAVFSLVLINSIRKSFKSIYLFKGGSVAYSILALVSALLYIGFLALHFRSSSAEYRNSVYFFLTSAVLIFEFITYILYTIFGFSYNSYIKKITLGITDSKSDINFFTAPPKNENYKPLNMWDDSDDKKQKNDNFSPQTVFDTIDTTDETETIPGEFDMWNKPEEEFEAPQSVVTPVIPTAVLNEPVTVATNNNTNLTPPSINPDPVFASANTTEPKHNRFEKWNDEVKSELENFDNEYQAQQNTRRENQTKNVPVDFSIPDTTFTENHTPAENTTTIQTPEFNYANNKPTYEPVSTQVTPDIQVGAEFIPQQSETKRTASIPENEDFASVELWDKPIMPTSRKNTSTPPIIIDHPYNNVPPANQSNGNGNGNEYLTSLWDTPIMNYGNDRPLRNSNGNPYVIPSSPAEKSKKASRREKRNKRNNTQQQYPQYPQYQQNSQRPQHPQIPQQPQQPQQPQKPQYPQNAQYTPHTQRPHHSQSQSQTVICPNCKSMCNEDVYFCIKCGTILK